MRVYINYGENQEGAGNEELHRFEDELLRQYNGNLEALAEDLEIWDRGILKCRVPENVYFERCDRYYDAEFAATKFAFAEWSRQPERVSFLVEVGLD